MESSTTITLVVLPLTVVAIVTLVGGVRGMVRRQEWTRSATMGLVLAMLVSSLIDIAVTFSASWLTELDAFGNIIYSFPSWAQLMQRGFFVLLLLASVVMFVVRVRRPGARFNVPAVLFVLVACVSDASAVLHGDNPFQPFYVVPLAVLVATTVAPRGLQVDMGLGTFCAVVACASGLAGVFYSKFSLLACGAGTKCGPAGVNLRGVFDNENALALYLVLSMPFIYLAFGRRRGALLAGYSAFLVVLTGSRSGSLAALVTLVVLLVVRPDLRRPHFSWPKVVVLYGALGAVFLGGVVMPLVVQDPGAFTSRGYLWMIARHQVASDPLALLVGLGPFGWQHVRESGLIDFSAVYSVHNEWLDIVYRTGLVGAALTLAALIVFVVHAGRRHLLVAGAVLLPVMMLGTTERPWAIDYADWLVWALPAALLCYPAAAVRPRPGPVPEPARASAPFSEVS